MSGSGQESVELMRDLGEEEVVRRLLGGLPSKSNVLIGPGDDCAVVDVGGEDLVLLKTDAVVAGVHFLPDTDPTRVGWKAVARVVSDFAAMGGTGGELLITIALAEECEMEWLEKLYRGVVSCASAYNCAIAGGETVGLPAGSATMVSVAGTGRVSRDCYVTRSSGQVGDDLWVTGVLGGSFESGHHLDFVPRVGEGQWLARQAGATAMMDLSDGLQRDLPRLAAASGCGFELEEQSLPCRDGCSAEQALGDGEDMELLFAAKEGEWVEAFRARFPLTRLTRIGQLTAESTQSLGSGGWQHFQNKTI